MNEDFLKNELEFYRRYRHEQSCLRYFDRFTWYTPDAVL
jgi:hypothetical protein